jgi:hypothetical protein
MSALGIRFMKNSFPSFSLGDLGVLASWRLGVLAVKNLFIPDMAAIRP